MIYNVVVFFVFLQPSALTKRFNSAFKVSIIPNDKTLLYNAVPETVEISQLENKNVL